MNETKHTPGPWKIEKRGERGDGGFLADISNIHTIFAVARIPSTQGLDPEEFDFDALNVEGMANARLIAAAPELLEALIKCDRAFANWQIGQIPGRPEDILELISTVRAAIAKAEGR